jgi:hypothetical protein
MMNERRLTLRDLEGQFIKRRDDAGSTVDVEHFSDADGVTFLCPCQEHFVLVWFRGKNVQPGEKSWRAEGSSLDDLTLSSSINFPITGCWHGFVRNGLVTR